METQLREWETCHTGTPWGRADGCKHITRGIVQYFTPSHGGYHVSAELLKTMPEYLQQDAYTPLGWFEEDCAWAKVAISFPQYFSTEDQSIAYQTLKAYYPEAYAKLMGNS